MPKFRKKPVVIEAFRYWTDNRPDWFCDEVTKNNIITHKEYCEIKTLEGVMRAQAGDYIIKGIKGEIYPCKPDIFEATYEKALNPCPLCGNKETYYGKEWFEDMGLRYFATCENCQLLTEGDTEDEAINKWNNLRNTRVNNN